MSNELGSFLRARRTDASLEPANRSLGSRRVSGLRREEVAAASGISVDYYTRLEQGRESNPSDSVLHAVGRVLKLEQDAIDHLFRLRATNGSRHVAADTDVEGLERAQALVAAVRPNPAYVLDRLSNVVAANPEGLALFDGLSELPAAQRNTCRYLLAHPRAREVFSDWEEIARGAVGHLRAANAGNLSEPALQAMVADLSAESPQFADWWTGHVVHRRRSSVQRIRSSSGGVIERRYEVLHLPRREVAHDTVAPVRLKRHVVHKSAWYGLLGHGRLRRANSLGGAEQNQNSEIFSDVVEPVLLTGGNEDDRPWCHLDGCVTPGKACSATADHVHLVLSVRLLPIAGTCPQGVRADAQVSRSKVFAVVGS